MKEVSDYEIFKWNLGSRFGLPNIMYPKHVLFLIIDKQN